MCIRDSITLIGSNFVEVYRLQQEEEAMKREQELQAEMLEKAGTEEGLDPSDISQIELSRAHTLGVGGNRMPWDPGSPLKMGRANGEMDSDAQDYAHAPTEALGGSTARVDRLEKRLERIETLLETLLEQSGAGTRTGAAAMRQRSVSGRPSSSSAS